MIRELKVGWLMAGLLILGTACGWPPKGDEPSVADCEKRDVPAVARKEVPCVAKSPDDKALVAMKDERYDDAISVLEENVPRVCEDTVPDGEEGAKAANPEQQGRYLLLAAAYARKVEIDYLRPTGSRVDITAVESGKTLTKNIQNMVDEVEEADYDATVTSLERAVSCLKAVKDDVHAIPSDWSEEFQLSHVIQSAFYRPILAALQISRFLDSKTGAVDRSTLENLTESEAKEIVANLDVSDGLSKVNGAEGFSKEVQDAVSQIESQPGSSTKEKLTKFLETTESSDS